MPKLIMSEDVREELSKALDALDRGDLIRKTKMDKVWRDERLTTGEDPTVEWVVEELLKLYPVKKYIAQVIANDPDYC